MIAGQSRGRGLLSDAFTALVVLLMLSPVAVLIFSAFNDGRAFRFPPPAYSLRWFEAAFASAEYRSSLATSTLIGAIAAALSVVIGTMAALPLARGGLRRRRAIELLLLAPLTLPLIVWSIALLQIYAFLGINGSLGGLVLAHATITLPYTVRIMIAAFEGIDPHLDAAARSLGAPPFTAFRRVTLPIVLPGLLTSAAFSFLVSFNDVIVSTFIAGSRWITFPVRLYSQLRSQGVDPITLAIGAMIVGAILLAAIAGELISRRWKRTRA